MINRPYQRNDKSATLESVDYSDSDRDLLYYPINIPSFSLPPRKPYLQPPRSPIPPHRVHADAAMPGFKSHTFPGFSIFRLPTKPYGPISVV